MALVRTTLSSAVAVADKSIVVASATGFAAGYVVLVGQEQMEVQKGYVSGTTIPVLRGQGGTKTQAHVASAGVVAGIATDWSDPATQTVVNFPAAGRARTVTSYSAAGAIAHPTAGSDAVAILNGTGVLAMTLADPAKDLDGSILYVLSNGAAAHTITYSTGFGGAGASYDVLTANGTGTTCVGFIAANEKWLLLHTVTGTLTNVGWAIA